MDFFNNNNCLEDNLSIVVPKGTNIGRQEIVLRLSLPTSSLSVSRSPWDRYSSDSNFPFSITRLISSCLHQIRGCGWGCYWLQIIGLSCFLTSPSVLKKGSEANIRNKFLSIVLILVFGVDPSDKNIAETPFYWSNLSIRRRSEMNLNRRCVEHLSMWFSRRINDLNSNEGVWRRLYQDKNQIFFRSGLHHHKSKPSLQSCSRTHKHSISRVICVINVKYYRTMDHDKV